MNIELDAILELVWETVEDEELSKLKAVLAKWLDTVEDELDYVCNVKVNNEDDE